MAASDIPPWLPFLHSPLRRPQEITKGACLFATGEPPTPSFPLPPLPFSLSDERNVTAVSLKRRKFPTLPFCRNESPHYGLYILNKKSEENFVKLLTPTLQWSADGDAYLSYQNDCGASSRAKEKIETGVGGNDRLTWRHWSSPRRLPTTALSLSPRREADDMGLRRRSR
jgi:hypothetical protein